ncbi:hypothetical protein ADIS_3460 [Lunatimonas lonarensis]|uniref:Pentapeptide repeat family protein n=1 Tax=Lunatimonas lonarensis TaxID=1232681 RepID=R7ZQH2_9BACT|nr:pentapeptide repeat-containing protein [Lunatimonas lonarensis]EON76332.1 hypothetical protein ADIS_3460 [Lunatimonas lonarensis]
METFLTSEQPDFKGNWEHLQAFLRLAASPIRTIEREKALIEWDEYKKRVQLDFFLSENGRENQPIRKSDYIQSLTAPAMDFTGAVFKDVCLGYVDLRGVRMDGVRFVHDLLCWTAMKGASFQSASLQHAKLPKCRLMNAIFQGANLAHADLTQADLENADLSYADLSNTILTGANLRNCNLSHANLNGADLREANLSLANLVHASCLVSNCPRRIRLKGRYGFVVLLYRSLKPDKTLHSGFYKSENIRILDKLGITQGKVVQKLAKVAFGDLV